MDIPSSGDDALDVGTDEPETTGDALDLGDDKTPSDDAPEGDAVKEIQKLTGQLGQKIREAQEIDSNTIKYVMNSVISAFDLSMLDQEDRDDILNKLNSVDSGMPDTNVDTGGDDIPEVSEDTLSKYLQEAVKLARKNS